jgi:Tol biopolymer transport system component
MKAIGYLRTTLVLGATMTAGLLTLTAVEPAGAAFPGGNGKIAFTSTRDGNVEIYTMNADGSSQARLTNATGNDASPAFSSDGSRIAFESSRPSSNPSDPSIDREIWVMNADGTSQAQITHNTSTDTEPTFSPDGAKVAFTSNRQAVDGTTDRDIWVQDLANPKNDPVNLTNSPGDDETPSWSPDGTKIAFRSDRPVGSSTDFDIWVMNADGSGTPTNLSNASAGNDSSPSWSPDGSKVAFDNLSPSGPSSVGEIFAVDATGNNLTQVTDPESHPGNQHPGAQGRPSFSPDGKKIAYFDEPTKEVFG